VLRESDNLGDGSNIKLEKTAEKPCLAFSSRRFDKATISLTRIIARAIALCSATEKTDAPSCENRTLGFLPASQRGVSSTRTISRGRHEDRRRRRLGQVSRCLKTRWARGADSIRSPNTAGITGIRKGCRSLGKRL